MIKIITEKKNLKNSRIEIFKLLIECYKLNLSIFKTQNLIKKIIQEEKIICLLIGC